MQLYPPSHYDDNQHGYREISTHPLASAMGAEIRGVDIANVSGPQLEEIKSALFRYKMIFFRNQHISLDDQEKFTLRFGPFGTDAYTKGIPGHPNVQRIIKEADTVVSRVFGDGWHTDSPFLQRPPAISLLHGLDIPPYGGDTWWANTELAYDFLSDTMKQVLAPLKVHMSAEVVMADLLANSREGKGLAIGQMQLTTDQQAIVDGWHHPIVRTHPVTGKKSLYVDETYSLGIQGMSREEAASLLAYLQKHVKREEFACRLRWEPNTLVMWDNRICIHKAFNDYDGYRREMIRTIVDGEVPA